MDNIAYLHAVTVTVLFQINRSTHISHILHSLSDFILCLLCLYTVINDGSVTYLPPEPVNPLCRIQTGCPIYVHRETEQAEPLGIRCLTHILVHLRRPYFLIIRLHLDIIQQILSLGNKLVDRTTGQHQKKYNNMDNGYTGRLLHKGQHKSYAISEAKITNN